MTIARDKILPNYIEARSPRALRLAMFKLNAEKGAMVKFFDIQNYKKENGRTFWIAWYYDGLESLDDL